MIYLDHTLARLGWHFTEQQSRFFLMLLEAKMFLKIAFSFIGTEAGEIA